MLAPPATVKPPAPEITPDIAEPPVLTVNTDPKDSPIVPAPLMREMLSLPPPIRLNAPALFANIVVVAKAAPSVSSVAPNEVFSALAVNADPPPVNERVPPLALMVLVTVFAPVSVITPVPVLFKIPLPEITPE